MIRRMINPFITGCLGALGIFFVASCDSDSPSGSSTTIEEFDPVPVAKTNDTKVYMHYMTWFESKESSNNNQWGYHWTMQNQNPDNVDAEGNREIASHYYPLIGPYHSGDEDVIEYHLLLMKYSGIDGILIDWYGTYDVNDYAMVRENTEQVVEMMDDVGLEYAIVYEDRFLNNVVNAEMAPTPESAAKRDMRYLESNFFSDPNYIEINNNPLLMVFGPITLETPERWTEVFSTLNTPPTFLTLWDSSSEAGENAQGEYAWVYENNSYLENFYTNTLPSLEIGMGGAYPGFKDFYQEGGSSSSIGWTIEHNNGATLDQTLQLASNNNLNYLQLITWNDFGEGTMFEPTEEFGFSYIEKVRDFTGADLNSNVFENIFKLFSFRKEYSRNADVQRKLDQAFEYFASVQPEKAVEILNSIEE
ncbi:glycoside hydrolase family 71/99-like protein [Salinimicrobium catena]|uniref:glycoside hydrolase family 71/99-like protein n=1 Tax=Salinimicrobium catena TaxID=390640 RepID=UPI002FE49D31